MSVLDSSSILQKEEEIDRDDNNENEIILGISNTINDEDNSNSYSNNSGDDYGLPTQNEDLIVDGGGGGSNNYRMRNTFWTDYNEAIFIERIRNAPCLYSHSDENWKNTEAKDAAWEAIATEIEIPANECRRHFKHMRDKFVRYKRTGRGNKSWKAADSMGFLLELDLIKHRGNNKFLMKDDDIEILGSISSCEKGLIQVSQSFPKRKAQDQVVEVTSSKQSRKSEDSIRIVSTSSLVHGSSGGTKQQSPHVLTQPQVVITSIPTLLTSASSKTINDQHQTNHLQSKGQSGPNFFFGQYISSVLDSLSHSDALLTRHKLQEILFEAQTKSVNSTPQIIQFQCTNCASVFAPVQTQSSTTELH